jgi:hypothetical protein
MISPIAFILGLFGIQFQISFYGFTTSNPLSYVGLCLIGIFVFKGIVALGLWTEKDWAIILGQIDAVLGIIICIFNMFIYPFINNHTGFGFSIRLELLLLIPFPIKLWNIKIDWQELTEGNE